MTAITKQLTPQERFKLTVAHKQPDRPPVNIWPTPEIWEKLALHFERRFGDHNLERALDIDFRGVSPTFIAPVAAPQKSSDARAMTTEDGVYQDVPLDNLLAAYEVATGKKLL